MEVVTEGNEAKEFLRREVTWRLVEAIYYMILPPGGILNRAIGREEEEPEVLVADLAQKNSDREPIRLGDREAALDPVVSDGKGRKRYLTKWAELSSVPVFPFLFNLCTLR